MGLSLQICDPSCESGENMSPVTFLKNSLKALNYGPLVCCMQPVPAMTNMETLIRNIIVMHYIEVQIQKEMIVSFS